MALRGFGSVPSSEEVDNVEADAAGAAGSRRTGMDGGSSGIHRVAAGSAATCRRGGHRAAPPSPRAEGRNRARAPAAPARPARPAAGARCRPATTTMFAAASLRSECLQLMRINYKKNSALIKLTRFKKKQYRSLQPIHSFY